ncbi:MAG: APC family permease [Bifidobacteriaceae bacterium]|jgi:amino acid transporter|nr:APC family permease [Bifidobacteriaceae bacterium]
MADKAPAGQLAPRKKLGLAGVLLPGLAQIAPAFNLLFTTAVVAGLAGASVPLVYLISMVGFLATALSTAQFAGIYPSAGGFVTYVARTFGAAVGTVAGFIMVIGYIIAFAGIYLYVGNYIVTYVFGYAEAQPAWLVVITTIVYGALVTIPVIVGLHFGVRATIVLYVIEVAVVLVVICAVLFQSGTDAVGLTAEPFTWPKQGASNIFLAFSVTVVAFGGFEAAAPLAEETDNPRRNVPIALVLTVLISGTLYVLGAWAQVAAFGNDGQAMYEDGNSFATAAQEFLHIGARFMVPFVAAIFLISVTSSYIAANTQTARVIFAGARGGIWPRSLAATSPRFKTPWAAAIAFVAPSIAIGVLSMLITDPDTTSGFLPGFGLFGVVMTYAITNVALFVQFFKFRKQGIRKNPFLWLVVPVIGVAVLALPMWGNLRPGQGGAFDWMPLWSLGLLAAGVVYVVVLKLTRPKVLAAAPALLEGDLAEPDQTAPVA